MKIEDIMANGFVDKCYYLADSALKDKEIPSNMKSLLYTSFIGFVAYYGIDYIEPIYRSYKDTPFLFKSKDYIKSCDKKENKYDQKLTLKAFNNINFHIRKVGNKKVIVDAEDSIVLEEKFDANTLICLVHELNHVINSKYKRINNSHSKNILRSGITEFSINQETGNLERKNNLLNEAFNQLQTMEIVDEILLICEYDIKNSFIRSCLDNLNSKKEEMDASKFYYDVRSFVSPIYHDKKFKSMYTENSLLGNIDLIDKNFITYTGSSIYEFGELVEEIFCEEPKKESLSKATSLIKKYKNIGKN